MKRRFFFVKTVADERQLPCRVSTGAETCDKSKMRFLEVNFFEERKKYEIVKINWEFVYFLKMDEKVNFMVDEEGNIFRIQFPMSIYYI